MAIALDPAANGFYRDGAYRVNGESLSSDAMIDRYAEMVDDLGFRLGPDARATAVAALWGGLDILHSVGEPPRHPRAVAMTLVLCQSPNGAIGARHRAIATLQATWRGLEANELLTRSKET